MESLKTFFSTLWAIYSVLVLFSAIGLVYVDFTHEEAIEEIREKAWSFATGATNDKVLNVLIAIVAIPTIFMIILMAALIELVMLVVKYVAIYSVKGIVKVAAFVYFLLTSLAAISLTGKILAFAIAIGVPAALVMIIAKRFKIAEGIKSDSADTSGDGSRLTREKDSWGKTRDLFKGRTESKPKQGFLESNQDYRERVYREGKERIIEDTTGSSPKPGFFETDEDYRSRISHEANERIVEDTTESSPKQGFLETDEDYRSRISYEANERIVETATESSPKQGFFETDEDYRSRINNEAKETKASRKD